VSDTAEQAAPTAADVAQLRAEVAKLQTALPEERAALAEALNRIFKRLGGLADGVDELLTDSRRARPLLDKYERKLPMPWQGKGVKRG